MFGVELAQGEKSLEILSERSDIFNWVGRLGQSCRDGREECVAQGNEQKKDLKAGNVWRNTERVLSG